ncbi:MAG: CcdB family protein [Alphaproteobacteria bacterium]
MSTAELAGVPKNMLGETVGTLDGSRDEVIAAVDFIIQGF